MPAPPVPPTIDAVRCTGCGLCVQVCPAMTLAVDGGVARIVHGEWCIECGHCAAVCPEEAVVSALVLDDGAPLPGAGPAVLAPTLQLLLRERRSVRRYRTEPVPREVLEALVEAVRYTPTGTNRQNVEVVVLQTPAAVTELRDRVLAFYRKLFRMVDNPAGRLGLRVAAGRETAAFLAGWRPVVREAEARIQAGDDRLLYDAPAVMLVHGPAADHSTPFNGAAALFAASMVAHARGLGCCFNGLAEAAIRHSTTLREWLGVPRDHRVPAVMTLGWPAVRYRRLVERRRPPVRWM